MNINPKIGRIVRINIATDIADYTIAGGADSECVRAYLESISKKFNVTLVQAMTIAKKTFGLKRVNNLWFRGNDVFYKE